MSGSFMSPFRTPDNNPERKTEPVKPPTPEQEAAKEAEIEKTLNPEKEKVDRVSTYLKNLEGGGITKSEAILAFDSILEQGYVEHRFSIRGRTGVFRSRTYQDTKRLTAAMEATRPSTSYGYDDIVSRYNLAASLCEWNGQKLPHASEKDFDAAIKYVSDLPTPVFGLLLAELTRFDARLMLIFADGATEAF